MEDNRSFSEIMRDLRATNQELCKVVKQFQESSFLRDLQNFTTQWHQVNREGVNE